MRHRDILRFPRRPARKTVGLIPTVDPDGPATLAFPIEPLGPPECIDAFEFDFPDDHIQAMATDHGGLTVAIYRYAPADAHRASQLPGSLVTQEDGTVYRIVGRTMAETAGRSAGLRVRAE